MRKLAGTMRLGDRDAADSYWIFLYRWADATPLACT